MGSESKRGATNPERQPGPRDQEAPVAKMTGRWGGEEPRNPASGRELFRVGVGGEVGGGRGSWPVSTLIC